MQLLISWGAHGRDPDAAAKIVRPVQFAHRLMPEDPEDTAHEASNFLKYQATLGGTDLDPVLIVPHLDDPTEDAHLRINAVDWASIVSSALNRPVEVDW